MSAPLPPPFGPPPPWRDRFLTRFRQRRWRGFNRIYALLQPGHGRNGLQVRTRYGSQFFLRPGDGVDRHVIEEGFYESEVLEAVRPSLTPGAVLWVVGANFGLHAVTAKCVAPEVTVVAFEPSPPMGARLLENCALNGVEVNLQAYALADAEGVQPFFANASGNPGMSTLHPCPGFAYEQRFGVATATAAAVIERGWAPPPDALILDAEGAETEVLRGFGAHLASPRLRRVVFEAPNDFLANRDPAELDACLRAAGLTWQALARRERTAHALSNFVALRDAP